MRYLDDIAWIGAWLGIMFAAGRWFWLNPLMVFVSVVSMAVCIISGAWLGAFSWVFLTAMFAWDTAHFRSRKHKKARV